MVWNLCNNVSVFALYNVSMKKVFLSTPVADKIDENGNVLPEYRLFIEAILDGLRKADIEVKAAVEYDGWRLDFDIPPEIAIKKDLEKVDASDELIALVNDKPSAGVQFEIGYAIAKSKRVILAHPTDQKLAYFNQGAVGNGMITLVSYEDTKALVAQLIVAVNAPEQ